MRRMKFLGAAYWVGAMTRSAEGSYMQLPFLYASRFRQQLGMNKALLRRISFLRRLESDQMSTQDGCNRSREYSEFHVPVFGS